MLGAAGVAQSSQIQPALSCAFERLANQGVPGPMGVPQIAQVSRSAFTVRWYATGWRGGDDGNRTRVNGFADRSLTTRARRHRSRGAIRAWLPREDSNLGSRIQSPLSYH